MIPKKILITGASGLVGSRLTEMLLESGHQVVHLGRSRKSGTIPSFIWDIEKGYIDEAAFEGVTAIVHLAGAGVADKRWTSKRKDEILESRTKSSALLFNYLNTLKHTVDTVVSASAIGIYGFGQSDEVFTENSKPAHDFLAQVVTAWEHEVDAITKLGIRVAKMRIGIVLSEKGGALLEMVKPIRYFLGAPLGTGKQQTSWIHLDDVCGMFMKAIEDHKMSGAYNVTGPYAVTNRELTRAIAKQINRPLLLPPVPAFVLKIIVGEMAEIVVNGSNVSSAKIQQAGYAFKFSTLEKALKDLLN